MLPRKGTEFLEVSSHLITQASNKACACPEVFFRSAISRAYYAAFNHMILILRQETVQIPHDGTAHKYLPECLKNSDKEELSELSDTLAELKTARTIADYKMKRDVSRTKADDVLSGANEIIGEFDQCMQQLDPSRKRQLASKMNKYLRTVIPPQKTPAIHAKSKGELGDKIKDFYKNTEH